ncbi:MAG: hypothetical protein HAW67_03785 [Endozoicomonadaceae bacterium]|nr:hypothetical protein [Endozoicomonadaceae bacterium]
MHALNQLYIFPLLAFSILPLSAVAETLSVVKELNTLPDTQSQKRSEVRNQEYLLELQNDLTDKELKRQQLLEKLSREEYIFKNVPVSIRIQGETAINAYLIKMHSEKPAALTVKSEPNRIKEIWSSTDSSLSIPIQVTSGWKEIVKPVDIHREDVETTQPPAKLVEDKLDSSASLLGLTKEDFKDLAISPPLPLETPVEIHKSVSLLDIEVLSYISSSKYKRATVKILFDINENDAHRKIEKKFVDLKIGELINIEDSRFEVMNITNNGIQIKKQSLMDDHL